MSVPWSDIFGNPHPVEVEIGPERGIFLLAAAAAHPERNFFGIERSHVRTRAFEARLERLALPNVRVVAADAVCALQTCVATGSVDVYHVYFPDPWWKRRHHRRRLLTPPFVALLETTLAPGGLIHLLTDVHETFELANASFRTARLLAASDPPLRAVRTAFEEKARRRGQPVYAASFRKISAG